MVDDMAFTQAFTPMKDGAKNAACYSWTRTFWCRCTRFTRMPVTIKHKTPTESVELATDIIENQFDAFTKKTLR
jgi:RNA polymerase sigma-54 factor